MNPVVLLRRAATGLAVAAFIGGSLAATEAPLASACVTGAVGGVAGSPLTSSNVDYVCTIPLDAPGNAGHIQTVDGQTRLYVSSRTGLSIYDVTDPAAAELLGHLPFQHWQNEDTSVADDGSRLLVAADGGFPLPDVVATGLYVFDTSDPTDIQLVGVHPDAPHTVTCAEATCTWLYASNGKIYDASGATASMTIVEGIAAARQGTAIGIEEVGTFALTAAGEPVSSLHASHRDASGLVITDSRPRLVLDPRDDPAHPVVVAEFLPDDSRDPRLQHGNQRPDADLHESRGNGYVPADLAEDPMRPGELLVTTSESNINPDCTNSGSIATWDLRGFDEGVTPTQLEVFHPVNGLPPSPDPVVNGAGCSAHWFDMAGELMAASWYDHGTRFMHIDTATGAIEQLGWFQPRSGLATATFWGSDGYAFTVDNTRGIDVVRFNQAAPVPTVDAFNASWLGARATTTVANILRYACRLGAADA